VLLHVHQQFGATVLLFCCCCICAHFARRFDRWIDSNLNDSFWLFCMQASPRFDRFPSILVRLITFVSMCVACICEWQVHCCCLLHSRSCDLPGFEPRTSHGLATGLCQVSTGSKVLWIYNALCVDIKRDHSAKDNFIYVNLTFICVALVRTVHPFLALTSSPQCVPNMCQNFGCANPAFLLVSVAIFNSIRIDVCHSLLELLLLLWPQSFFQFGCHFLLEGIWCHHQWPQESTLTTQRFSSVPNDGRLRFLTSLARLRIVMNRISPLSGSSQIKIIHWNCFHWYYFVVLQYVSHLFWLPVLILRPQHEKIYIASI